MIARPSIPFGWHRVSRGTVRKGDVKLHWYVNCGLIEMRWVLGSLIPGSVIRPEHGSTAFSGISADLAPLIVEAVNQVPTLRAELLAAQSKLAALEKENAALRADKARLDWMETYAERASTAVVPEWFSLLEDVAAGRLPSYRAAIDSARKVNQ